MADSHVPDTATPSRAVLAADHARIERIFEDLLAALNAGARSDADRLWAELESGLTGHMAIEEQWLFPAIVDAPSREIAELRAEHAKVRDLLRELGASMGVHPLTPETLQLLRRALRRHAQREEALAYQLADFGVEGTARERLRHHLKLSSSAARTPLDRPAGPPSSSTRHRPT